MTLKEFKKEIDLKINNLIENKINGLSNDDDLLFLIKQFEYLKEFIKDGKRVRPYISYITYLSFGGKNKKDILPLLVFLEIFHYFCLIHDDIMDNSEKRHGIPTINKKFGTAQAILLGDYLFFWTWEIITSAELDNKKSKELIKSFSEMVGNVFLGQFLDIDSVKKLNISDDLILKKTLNKTAGYTFVKPMLIGLVLGDEFKDKNIKFCEKLGTNLGLAYQLQDDLLDITSDFNGNKTPLSDISEGIPTLFSNYVFKNGSEKDKKILTNNFGNKIKNTEVVKKVFYDSGAISYGENIIKSNLSEAKRILEKQEMNKEYKDKFLEVVNLIEERKN